MSGARTGGGESWRGSLCVSRIGGVLRNLPSACGGGKARGAGAWRRHCGAESGWL